MWVWEYARRTGDFNLLAVFRDFLKVVVERCELLELFLKVVLHLGSDLIGALGDDAYGLIDVAGVLAHCDEVTCLGVERCVGLLVVHFLYCQSCCLFLGVFTRNLEDILSLVAVRGVGVIVDEGVIFINNLTETVGLAFVDTFTGLLVA